MFSLVTYSLSSNPILPMNFTHYAATLRNYTTDLAYYIAAHNLTHKLPLDHLRMAADTFADLSLGFEDLRARVDRDLNKAGYSNEDPKMWWRRKWVNGRMGGLEAGFLSEMGLPFRNWYKHGTLFSSSSPFLLTRIIHH